MKRVLRAIWISLKQWWAGLIILVLLLPPWTAGTWWYIIASVFSSLCLVGFIVTAFKEYKKLK